MKCQPGFVGGTLETCCRQRNTRVYTPRPPVERYVIPDNPPARVCSIGAELSPPDTSNRSSARTSLPRLASLHPLPQPTRPRTPHGRRRRRRTRAMHTISRLQVAICYDCYFRFNDACHSLTHTTTPHCVHALQLISYSKTGHLDTPRPKDTRASIHPRSTCSATPPTSALPPSCPRRSLRPRRARTRPRRDLVHPRPRPAPCQPRTGDPRSLVGPCSSSLRSLARWILSTGPPPQHPPLATAGRVHTALQ